jgi:mono/diheme cytochrome c family protein
MVLSSRGRFLLESSPLESESGNVPPARREERDFEMKLSSRCKTTLLLGVLAVACSVTPRGASDPNLAIARDKAAQGASVFARECAGCHGQRGEGVTAPAILGSDGLPLYPRDPSQSTLAANTDPNEQQLRQQLNPGGMPSRQSFKTAQDVYEYVHLKMPAKRAGTLTTQDYWAVVNFMLVAQGLKVPDKGIDSGNAREVVVNP